MSSLATGIHLMKVKDRPEAEGALVTLFGTGGSCPNTTAPYGISTYVVIKLGRNDLPESTSGCELLHAMLAGLGEVPPHTA
uniref:Uncharacterized protein n=1 Tax=Sphaerodactylus townsendi TaxID=933632 RepID=A0ACB8F142_9SAUR